MQAVVAALDQAHYQKVEDLWAELERMFGVGRMEVTFPHITFLACEQFDRGLLEAGLRRVAGQTPPLLARADGLGIFIGLRPVLYISIVRSQELTAAHRLLWREVRDACTGPVSYYQPDHWMPHITLAICDLHTGRLAEMVKLLSEQDFTWDITLDNLCLIENTTVRQEPQLRTQLGGTIAESTTYD